MREKNTLTILGLGNILFGDEGFGVHFVRWFAGRYRLPAGIEIVEGGTMGYMLLDIVCGCRTLIVIDCLKTADVPGSLYRFTRAQLSERLPPPTSAHEVKFADVLCKAEMLDECPDLVFLCVVPECYQEMDLEMTSTVRGRFPALSALLMRELAGLGVRPEALHA